MDCKISQFRLQKITKIKKNTITTRKKVKINYFLNSLPQPKKVKINKIVYIKK